VLSASLARGTGFAWRRTGDAALTLPAGGGPGLRAGYHEIGPRFLETLGIPVLRGREFDERDREGAPRTVLVNRSLAAALWPAAEPLGRTILVDGLSCTIVGVFRDSQLHPASEAPPPFFYLAYWQFAFGHPIDSRFVVRVAGDPKAMLGRLRSAALAVDPSIPVTELMTLPEQVSGAMADVFLASRVAAAAGIATVLLAAIGLHGLLAAVLFRRKSEFALRMALGAGARDIRRLIAGDASRLVGAGIAAGAGLAIILTRAMRAFLFDTAALDARALLSSAAVLAGAALLAAWRPALRAGRVDPAAALRES
jgi:hypothetical protein